MPTQGEWTLRFKQHKTTILLYVAPGQTFASIKQDLLDAMKARGIGDINGNAMPLDPEAIILGLPIDKNDIDKGWVPLKIPEMEDKDVKGKGVKKGSVLNENPLGAGLKDGAMLAFKFREGDDTADTDDGWDVVMPTYEEESASQGRS